MLYTVIDPGFSQLPQQYYILFAIVYGIVALIGLIQLVIGIVLIVKETNLRNANRNEALLLLNNFDNKTTKESAVEILENDIGKKTE